MAILIEAPTIKTDETLVKIIKEGLKLQMKGGSKTIELRNTLVSVENPLKLDIPSGLLLSGEKLEIYAEQFLVTIRRVCLHLWKRLRKHFKT